MAFKTTNAVEGAERPDLRDHAGAWSRAVSLKKENDMRTAFEAVWEHGQIVPRERMQMKEHTPLLVVILDKIQPMPSLLQEARRQSLLVSQHQDGEDEIWEANIDDRDWRG